MLDKFLARIDVRDEFTEAHMTSGGLAASTHRWRAEDQRKHWPMFDSRWQVISYLGYAR